MANPAPENKGAEQYNRFALARALDRCAKWWWCTSLISKLLGFVTGLFAVLPTSAEPVPFVVAVFTLVSELSLYRSDDIKSRAQGFRRKLDMQDSFGWEISGAEMADLLVRCPQSVKVRAEVVTSEAPYFSSKEPAGTRRALHNVSESAWWTKHLSERMSQVCLTVLVLGILIALVVLIVALHTVGKTDARASVAKVVTGLLMLLLSMGALRLTLSYHALAQVAARVEQAAAGLLQSGDLEPVAAIKVMNEYHVARASGPIIPTWIWKLRRDELNATWDRYRSAD